MGYKEDYKTGDWYEIERKQCYGEYDPNKIYYTKKIINGEESLIYDEEGHNHVKYFYMIIWGKYRELFEQAETILKSEFKLKLIGKPTVIDYHKIYIWIYRILVSLIFKDNLWVLMTGNELSITYEDIEVAFYNETKKLNDVFNEFVKSDNDTDTNIIPIIELSDWQKHLKGKGLLYPDGLRVVKSLEKTVREYVQHTGNETTWRFVQENFLKKDLSKYSKKQCEIAVAFANT